MSHRFRPTDAYVDESIRGRRYVMGCVLVEARHLATLRPAVEDLASGIAPRIHFNNDTDRQKRRVLDAIAEMPIQVFATVCTKDHDTNGCYGSRTPSRGRSAPALGGAIDWETCSPR